MKIWEYCTVTIDPSWIYVYSHELSGHKTIKLQHNRLNIDHHRLMAELGSNGWELVSVTVDERFTNLYFKRPLEQ
jgi:hypothetical protein